MKIIEINALENGAHRNRESSFIKAVPGGWTVIPDTITIPATFPFVDIEVADGVVTSMTANQTAYDAAQAAAQAEQGEQPTTEDVTLDILADHEERICMIELNTTTE